jgi:hypothetical protein
MKSPITAEATTLGPFTEAEVGELVQQHTDATGQHFSPEAVARIWELGCGHPWLTNALADQIVRRDVKDRNVEITAAHVDAAKETIILERRTHIDSLVARLREDRVRQVIAPMLAGGTAESDVLDDDFGYVVGLGLVCLRGGHWEIANPIYQEVIPRALTHAQQGQIANEPTWYVRPDGSLDMPKLLVDWQVFWRKDGHLAAEGFRYREAGPHLMLMAFLQRVVNGGGRIEREYGLGARGARSDDRVARAAARHRAQAAARHRDRRRGARPARAVPRARGAARGLAGDVRSAHHGELGRAAHHAGAGAPRQAGARGGVLRQRRARHERSAGCPRRPVFPITAGCRTRGSTTAASARCGYGRDGGAHAAEVTFSLTTCG